MWFRFRPPAGRPAWDTVGCISASEQLVHPNSSTPVFAGWRILLKAVAQTVVILFFRTVYTDQQPGAKSNSGQAGRPPPQFQARKNDQVHSCGFRRSFFSIGRPRSNDL